MPQSWPRTARDVMEEIAARIGVPLDPRTIIATNNVEETALDMTMREVAGYIAALECGNWTITDGGYLYLVRPAAPNEDDEPEISAHNAEELSVGEPLEAWSGVKIIWDGEEWNAQDPALGDDTLITVKRGELVGSAGNESGRVLTVKAAFGQVAAVNPAHIFDTNARYMLSQISGKAYSPFEARNVVLDPAAELGDAVTLPDGTKLRVYALSGELDGLCAVDVSAPSDEALNSAYPSGWL